MTKGAVLHRTTDQTRQSLGYHHHFLNKMQSLQPLRQSLQLLPITLQDAVHTKPGRNAKLDTRNAETVTNRTSGGGLDL
jgi:hypothetical protein